MLLLVADENLNNTIVRGLLRVKPSLDIVRVQDVGLSSADDPDVLEWAAQQNRILLTHDVATLTKYAYERLFLNSLAKTLKVSFANENDHFDGGFLQILALVCGKNL